MTTDANINKQKIGGKQNALIVTEKGELIFPHFWWEITGKLNAASYPESMFFLRLYEDGNGSHDTWRNVVKSVNFSEYSDTYNVLDIECETGGYYGGSSIIGVFIVGGSVFSGLTFNNPPAGEYTAVWANDNLYTHTDNIEQITASGTLEISPKYWETLELEITTTDDTESYSLGLLVGEQSSPRSFSTADGQIKLIYEQDMCNIGFICPHLDDFKDNEKITVQPTKEKFANIVPSPLIAADIARITLRRLIPKQ